MKREAGELLVCPHCRETQEAVILLDEERVQCISCGQPFWAFVTMDDAPSFIVMASDPSLDQIALGVEISTSASESELDEARAQARDLQQKLDLAIAENKGLRDKIYGEVMSLLRRSRDYTEAAQESSSGCSRIVREKLMSELEAKKTIIQLVEALQRGQL